jgi:UPF0755 protein
VKIAIDSQLLRSVLALVLAFTSTFFLHLTRSQVRSAPDFPCEVQSKTTARIEMAQIEIAKGETGSEIAQSLEKAGVVKSADAYFRVAVGDSRSQMVSPGTHRIDVGICAEKALEQLLDVRRISGLISVVEGAWLSEILPQFYEAGFSQSEVAEALRSVTKPRGFSSIEGLIFPAQYSFASGTTALTALQSAVDRSVLEMKKAGFFNKSSSFTAQQLLIIASLIQAEGNSQDFSRISQVIRNRLVKGMPLQFDSTVHYVKKSRGKVFLSTQSTLINSPYNTYQRYGLPPGPINNPGADALKAAINPLKGDWLYFITVAPFDTRFTSDINQFNLWKVEYKKNLRAGKFRSNP